MFITFEGVEGSGKTTQAKVLTQYLNEKKVPTVFTREPGGTILAESIRSLILQDSGINNPLTEFLLFTAARHDHFENFIKPKLAEGYIVICDRFFDSTIAYQGGVKGSNNQIMQSIHRQVFGNFMPKITFLIDISPQVSLNRITSNREINHYDKRDLNFHNQIRESFLKIANNEKDRFRIIDGNLSQNQVTKSILDTLHQLKFFK